MVLFSETKGVYPLGNFWQSHLPINDTFWACLKMYLYIHMFLPTTGSSSGINKLKSKLFHRLTGQRSDPAVRPSSADDGVGQPR